MSSYILRRIAQVVPVVFLVSVIVFLMLHLAPGDPAMVILSARAVDFTAEEVEELRRDLGLDRPLVVQYVTWVGNLAQGDFGRSMYLRRDIGPLLAQRLGATGILALAALIFAIPVGIAAGIIASINRNSIWDRVTNATVVAGIAVPSFALGLFLIVVFGARLGWFPVSGMASFDGGGLLDRLHHLILPAITLGVAPAAVIARLTRSSMLEVLNEDYIRTSRAKGLSEWVVVGRHAFRNVLITVVTVVGLQTGFLLGGAVLVEIVFSWPGMGQLIITGVLQRDFPVVQAGVLAVSLSYVLINLLVDILYAFIDPRIRYS